MQIHHNFDYTLESCKLRTHACWKSGSAGPNDSRALKQFHLTRERTGKEKTGGHEERARLSQSGQWLRTT